jgi:anionic cell wall polymer biosynthesis LytR-Cps2A-Psr (LCP) family protein
LPDGDFGRSAHQSELLLAAAVAARLSGPGIIPKEMTIVSKHAQSDLSAAEALTFVASFYKVNPLKVGHRVAKGGFGTSADGQSIVILDAASKQAFRDFRDGRL